METRTEESIVALLSMYQPVIRACCRFHHLPDDRVEDITHDTFLAAYRNLASYNGQGKMSAWLWSIARHKIIDQTKRESTRRRFEGAWGCLQSLVETTEPATLAQTKELCDALREAVETLPQDWTKVVTRHYWHQENAKQIAKRMQIKPSTVSVILYRSRKRLRENLESMLTQSNVALAVAS
ncbi:MAG: sigma-70 family RNA polymerase sigma factor [Phycisphaerales bacterium]|nr:MAG: sigma-70 family RNA polymerase sigma factor [Phycisphaerales bacterium]